MRKGLMFFVIGIFLISFIAASCTVTLDKESYVAGETATAAMACSTNPEKNTDYNLTWTNQTGTINETDSGTTPSVAGQMFYESFTIPTEWPNGVWLNATLNGEGLTVTQNDSANVTSSGGGGANTLEIVNTTFGGGYLGLVGSVKAVVTDENGKKISGGKCKVSGLSNDETKVLIDKTTAIFNGNIEVSEIMPAARFDESTDYAYKIDCYCGSNVSGTECIDEDGTYITGSVGSAKNFFTTSQWLNVSTVTDGSLYSLKDDIFVCANVTNIDYSYRIPLYIYYEIRCSANNENDNDTDRTLISYNKLDDPDIRGISASTTQMQCKKFKIPEENYLMGQNSECYASTNVWVLDATDEEIFGYSTTSAVFNISSSELNLQGDWQWIDDTKINTIINLSSYADISGTGTGDVDVRIDFPSDGVEIHHDITSLNIFENVTIYNTTGLLTEHTDYEFEILEDGYLELEIRNVDLSSGWWNITIDFYDLGLREVEALEGIENKTGTFHLDVDCPSQGTIGGGMDCAITAYIEDTQLVQKEVDFTCYITDGITQYNSQNFNQMITRSAVSIVREFTIPSAFTDRQSYVLQCHADYYNLGSRRDSFYDTFTASALGEPGGSITGEAVDEGEGEKGEGEKKDFEDIAKEFNPFSPERNWVFVFVEGIVLIGIIVLIILYIRKRKKKHVYYKPKTKDKKIIKRIFLILTGIIILIGIIIAIVYLCNYLSALPKSQSVSEGLIHDRLFRGIILTAFIVAMIIILFKVLNIRGEIRFGDDYSTRKYHTDKKTSRMQQKLNQMILKNEIKKSMLKEDYKVRKMTPSQFREFVRKRKEDKRG